MKRARHSTDQPIGCQVFVQNDKGQILAGKRKNSYKAGCYGIPGGRVDGEEKLIDCAKRELYEETGLKALDLKYIGFVREWQSTYTFIHFIFLSTKWKGKPKNVEPDKCEGWEWHLPNKVPKFLPGHKAALGLLIKKGYIDM